MILYFAYLSIKSIFFVVFFSSLIHMISKYLHYIRYWDKTNLAFGVQTPGKVTGPKSNKKD